MQEISTVSIAYGLIIQMLGVNHGGCWKMSVKHYSDFIIRQSGHDLLLSYCAALF